MQIGVGFPTVELGNDVAKVRDFAQAAEQLGYRHLLTIDHVLSAEPDRFLGWDGNFSYKDALWEPLTLFAYLAGVTRDLGFTSGILILPQRQTALVAKQAAIVDRLCGGRLRLGVGLGWSPLEYECLNEDFRTRGARLPEQVELLRRLWTEDMVDFRGKYHRVDRAGINPVPIQRPIPIWMGAGLAKRGGAAPERTLRRMAALADGWIAMVPPTEELLARVRGYVREAGRDPGAFGLECWISAAQGGPDTWAARAERLEELGCTHLTFMMLMAGAGPFDAYISNLRRFRETVPGF
jgi:probable F420-dependent oxidoreductase